VGAALAGVFWLVLVQLCPERLRCTKKCLFPPPKQPEISEVFSTPSPLHLQPTEPSDYSFQVKTSAMTNGDELDTQRVESSAVHGSGHSHNMKVAGDGVVFVERCRYLSKRTPDHPNPKSVMARLAVKVANQWSSESQALHGEQEIHVANLDQLQPTMAEHIRQLSMQHTEDIYRIESRLRAVVADRLPGLPPPSGTRQPGAPLPSI
jgi:hypothetical protein